jgi:hypothetical protein
MRGSVGSEEVWGVREWGSGGAALRLSPADTLRVSWMPERAIRSVSGVGGEILISNLK